ncbi:MAG: NADH:flavin oxidoreductase [Ruminococcaceae bacterium]|nr:NADH:flavin oxidoreductase [Oscillospiraceae bacterium]MBR3595465.1 NADH:flavin oxidoreductase [Clostridia bacterium]
MLFNETKISGINVKNRIIRSATHDGLADKNGAPSDKLIKKYEHLAQNEIGCIITGYAAVSKNGVSPYPGMLKIYNDDVIDKYKELTDAVHRLGTPVVLQIAHCGRQTSSKAIGMPKVAPSDVLHTFYPDKAKELTENEIYCIIDYFISAAVRTEKAGFDGVQLHGGHGYLLHDFLSPYGNRRKDNWGGSLENRCRIVELIIRGIKEKTNLPVWIKLSAEDNRKNGMNLQSSVEICRRLEAVGCDAIEVSCGTVQDGMNTMRSKLMPMDAVFRYREPCASFPKLLNKIALPAANLINPLIRQPKPLENFNVGNASEIKKNVSIPIIVVGGIHKVSDMEKILTKGKADFISMCRPFICEPDLAAKLKNGQAEAKCIMCNFCGLVIEKEPTKCLYGNVKN